MLPYFDPTLTVNAFSLPLLPKRYSGCAKDSMSAQWMRGIIHHVRANGFICLVAF